MAYGRLDVFWPDGLYRSYPLSEPNTSVGRSPGNAIALDTNGMSRYHFTLLYESGQVYLTDLDSANGTYIDGVRIPVNERQALFGGEEIMVGELRLIYYYLDETPTRPMIVPEDTTQRLELEAANFRIDLEQPGQPVAPGSHISADLVITNTGDQTERYVVEVTGVPREWVRIERPTVELGAAKSAHIAISFKPLRRSGSAPGDYPISITVRRDHRDSDVFLKADLSLHVLPFGGFGMALEQPKLDQGERFRLHVHNQGSAPLPLTVVGRDPTNMLTFSIAPSQMTLVPGQRLLVTGEAKPRRAPMFGEARQFTFDILARSGDAAGFVAATRAYQTVRPPLPLWAPLAAGGAALVLVTIVAALVIALLTNVPQPTISSFTVSNQQVIQGEPVQLGWNASNVGEFQLRVNGTPVALEQGATAYTLNSTELDGDVTVELLIANRSGSASASQTFTVVRPMTVNLFTAEPARLVRYVVQPLDVRWNVPGATLVRITGLNDFTNTPLPANFEAEGALDNLTGIPTGPLTLTLFAQDAQGRAVEQSISVEVIDPVCTSGNEAVELRRGPAEDYQVIGTVPPETSVLVDAQDASTQWLRVGLPGGASGWGARTAFTCDETFNTENLRQELNIPTPFPSATPTLAPTTGATGTPPTATRPAATATPRATQTGTP